MRASRARATTFSPRASCSRFVPADVPWAHVDLSSATRSGGLAHVSTEITGFGVRCALELLLRQDWRQLRGMQPRKHAAPARPDDWHLHLRDGAALAAVLPFTARAVRARDRHAEPASRR